MKIAVLDDYQNVVRDLACNQLLADCELSYFTRKMDTAALCRALVPFEAIVLIRERTNLGVELLRGLPNLKLVSQTGKAGEHICLPCLSKAGIALLEGSGNAIAPAELCWALIMASRRHLSAYHSELQTGQWQQNRGLGLGCRLAGDCLGIWGYGKIGKRIAQYGRAFDMKVLIWGSEDGRQRAVADGFTVAVDKHSFFAAADVLTVHLRLNNNTRGIINRHDLAAMKHDALFVNTSRAELLEADALEQALLAGRPGFAALDVFADEPTLPQNNRLLGLPNVLATPHIGFVEKQGYELYFTAAFQNIREYIDGRREHVSNLAALREHGFNN